MSHYAPRLFGSLTIRVTAGLLCAVLVSSALLLGSLYWVGVHVPVERSQSLVRAESRRMTEVYREGGVAALRSALEARAAAPAASKAFHALLGRDGSLISGNLPSWPMQRRSGWRYLEADLYRDGDEDDHEAMSRDIMLPGGLRLIIGRDVEQFTDRQELIGLVAIWGSLGAILLSLVGGWVTSRVIGRRLERLNRTALTVMAGDLGHRMRTSGTGDDFDQLATTLNAMLDRIEQLVASVSRISDSVAHELRTPLTRLRTTLEEISASELSAAQQAVVHQALAEADGLHKTFDALLRIARVETRQRRLAESDLAAEELLDDAADLYRPAAEARNQALALDVEAGLTVRADRDLLFQAIANLLDNCVKFTPPGGTISVTGRLHGGRATIVVTDNGPGVAHASIDRLTERFYRAPETAASPGIGLGLSLVAAVAEAHGAELGIAAENGFVVRLVFPEDRSSISAA